MHVHHPLHPAHKKKWKECLLEFFMLFLAIVPGFLAENIREAKVEKHKEKELSQPGSGFKRRYWPPDRDLYSFSSNQHRNDGYFVRLSGQDLTNLENSMAVARLYLFYGIRFMHFKLTMKTLHN